VAHNIIADFGHGDSWWIWGTGGFTRAPILFDRGQEPDDPPLRDVLVTGNVVIDSGRDGMLVDDVPPPPRHRHAVHVSEGTNGPQGLRFHGNLFHPGTEGISNRTLEP